jgi:hypothetical protein
MYTAGKGRDWFRRVRVGGLILVTAAAVVPWVAGTAQASVYPGRCG